MVLARRLGTALKIVIGLASMAGAPGCAAELAMTPAATVEVDADVRPVASVRTALDPYGHWITVAGYGEVWQPNVAVVGVDFIPYASAGGWVSTDAGWAFESDYGWGWAPFHYGHWFQQPGVGWVWLPGTTWSPAAVEWRTGGGVVGWAPSPPRGIELRQEHFTFVETAKLTERNVVTVALPPARREAAFRASVSLPVEVHAGVTVASRGPRVEEIEAATGRHLEVRHVEAPRAGLVAEVHVRAEVRAEARAAEERHDAARANEDRHEAAEADAHARKLEEASRVHSEDAKADAERAGQQQEEAAKDRAQARRDEAVAARERENAARAARRANAGHARKEAHHQGFRAGK